MKKLLLINEHENSNKYLVSLCKGKDLSVFNINVNTNIVDLAKVILNSDELLYDADLSDSNLMTIFIDALFLVNKSLKIYMYGINLKSALERILSNAEQYKISTQYKLFEISNICETPVQINFNMNTKIESLKNSIRNKAKKYSFTGRYIQILDILHVDENMSNISKNYVVNEIDCSDIDSTGEGVWVYGVNAPVKLMNRHNLKEYDILNNATPYTAILVHLKRFSNVAASKLASIVDDVLQLELDCAGKCSFILAFAKVNIPDKHYMHNLELLILQHESTL